MKTLEQLWKENGEKFPLKVKYSTASPIYEVYVGKTPSGKFYGYSFLAR